MSEITPFLVLAAERTGSNLLAGLLDSHPEVIACGELFNPVLRKDGEVPWRLVSKKTQKELAALRESDPVAFLETLGGSAQAAGKRYVGFKLLYFHADRCPEIKDHLIADTRFRVLHLTRRNLLRRHVSLQRARLTGRWQQTRREKRPAEQPKVELSLHALVEDVLRIQRWERGAREAFAEHPVMELTYEELAADPSEVGRRALEFLGAEASGKLDVRYRKTGTDSLREAIANYDEVRGEVERLLAYFDD